VSLGIPALFKVTVASFLPAARSSSEIKAFTDVPGLGGSRVSTPRSEKYIFPSDSKRMRREKAAMLCSGWSKAGLYIERMNKGRSSQAVRRYY
jgi:hypothetical protein